jgi:hypothetical protein
VSHVWYAVNGWLGLELVLPGDLFGLIDAVSLLGDSNMVRFGLILYTFGCVVYLEILQ